MPSASALLRRITERLARAERWLAGGGRRRRWAVLAVLVAICLLCVAPRLGRTDLRKEGDTAQYLALAWHVAVSGSFATGPAEAPVATARREPGWPALLSLIVAADSRLQEAGPRGVASDPGGAWFPARLAAYGLLLIAAACTASLARRASGLALAGPVAFALVALSPRLVFHADGLFQEALITPLLACAMLAVWRAAGGRWAWGLAAGLALGAAALTRAHFLHVALIAIPMWAVLAYAARRRPADLLPPLCALLALAVAVAPWMLRNQRMFGEAMISRRGGEILTIRASYDRMRSDEWAVAFLYYLKVGKPVREALCGAGTDARLERENPDGFYRQAKESIPRMAQERGLSLEEADAVRRQESLAAIKAAPLRHLAVSLPLAIAGTPSAVPGLAVPGNLVVLILGLAVLLWALRRRGDLAACLLVPAGSVAFCILLTHNIPRYNEPAIPALLVALAVAIGWLLARRRRQRRLAMAAYQPANAAAQAPSP